MNINLVCVGQLKEEFWKEAVAEYQKRLQRFCKINIKELSEQNKYQDKNRILFEEGREILENMQGYSILLDIDGKELSSQQLADKLKNIAQQQSTINFIIGGSYGVSDEVKNRADERLSLGKITLPHNLARVVVIEQIYRAFMINSGSKYHK